MREKFPDLYFASMVKLAKIDRVDSVGALRTWEWSSVSSWYKNSKGRSAQNYPFSALELVQRSASIDQTDFIVS
jgi:hypothetical protein